MIDNSLRCDPSPDTTVYTSSRQIRYLFSPLVVLCVWSTSCPRGESVLPHYGFSFRPRPRGTGLGSCGRGPGWVEEGVQTVFIESVVLKGEDPSDGLDLHRHGWGPVSRTTEDPDVGPVSDPQRPSTRESVSDQTILHWSEPLDSPVSDWCPRTGLLCVVPREGFVDRRRCGSPVTQRHWSWSNE